MAFIKVLNDDKYTLIDDTFQNYVFSGVFNYTLGWNTQYAWERNPDPFMYAGHAGSDPVLALYSDSNDFLLPLPLTRYRSGNNFYWKFYGSVRGNYALKIYVFDKPNGAAQGMIKVRNAEGKVGFDSSRKYMKVLHAHVGNNNVSPVFPGKTALMYATTPLGWGRTMMRDPFNGQYSYFLDFYAPCARKQGTSFAFSVKVVDTYGTTNYPPASPLFPSGAVLGNSAALVIDVTGL